MGEFSTLMQDKMVSDKTKIEYPGAPAPEKRDAGAGADPLKLDEAFYGEQMYRVMHETVPLSRLVAEQTLSQRVYESRIASMQRAVSFFVMFHAMGKSVQEKGWTLL